MDFDNRFFVDLILREIVKQFSDKVEEVMSKNYGIHWNTKPLRNYNPRLNNIHHITHSSPEDPVTILTLLSTPNVLDNFITAGYQWAGFYQQIQTAAQRLRVSRNDWAHFDPNMSRNRNIQAMLATAKRLFEMTGFQEGKENIEKLIDLHRELRANAGIQVALTDEQIQIENSLNEVKEDEGDSIQELETDAVALQQFQTKILKKYTNITQNAQLRKLAKEFLRLHYHRSCGKYTYISETDYNTIDAVLKAFLQENSLMYPGELKKESEDLQRLLHYREQLNDAFESFDVWRANFGTD